MRKWVFFALFFISFLKIMTQKKKQHLKFSNEGKIYSKRAPSLKYWYFKANLTQFLKA